MSAANTLQSITGFGASSAWTAPNLSNELSDQLFSPELGIGLSLLRLRITPQGTSDEFPTAAKAIARGARVWASPWSPPGEWKTNGSALNGGSLLPERYQAWADRLADFVVSAAQQDISIMYLSAQNEPNYEAGWETCIWTPGELTRFLGEYLGPAVENVGLGTRLLAPETQDWRTLEEFSEPLLADDVASSFVGAIAVHGYGGEAYQYSAPADAGKELWVTELDDAPGGSPDEGHDPTMGSGIKVALRLHNDLTRAPVNAWHYWWISPRTDLPLTNNGAITDGTELTRRAYVMGNWSKFVRPGFLRVSATGAPQAGVFVTAFRDESGEQLVIVAINATDAEISQSFQVDGAELDTMTPYVTSDELALERLDEQPVVDGGFSYTLPALSVTTFVTNPTNIEAPDGGPEGPRYPTRPVSNESGCSCRVTARGNDGGTLFAILGVGLLALRARRRAPPLPIA